MNPEVEQGADASPEYVDKSIDTSIIEEPVEVETEAEDPVAEKESEAESPPAVEEDDDKKTNPFQERIDTLTKKWRETDRSLTAMEQENERLRKQVSEIPVNQSKTMADFDYNEEAYRDYLFEEAQTLARQTVQQELGRAKQDTERQTLQERFADKEETFIKQNPDYREKVYDPNLRISGVMAEEAQRSELSTEILYYLASNPTEAAEMYSKPEREVIRDIVKLEDKLRSEMEKSSLKVSNAPPPPKKIKAGDPGSSKDPSQMSDKEFANWRRKQIAQR